MMIQPKTSNYAENEVIGQLEVLIATIQQFLQKKAYPCQNSEKCYKYGKLKHIARDCMSEKVLMIWS